MNVGLTLAMSTDAREFIDVGESVLPMRVSVWGGWGGSVLVWGGIMGGNKTHLIFINRNINAQNYINDVIGVEALPFIQFHGPNGTFMHDNARPHSATITTQVFGDK